MRRNAIHLLWLAGLWVALWGDLSVGNVIAGLLLAGLLVLAFPRQSSAVRTHLRPLKALSFAGHFLRKFLEANAVVAWEVITPNNESVNEAIVAVPLPAVSDGITTLVASAITLTPGTLVVAIDRDPTVLYVHVLHLRDVEDVRRDVLDLERRAVEAFGPADAVDAARRQQRDRPPSPQEGP